MADAIEPFCRRVDQALAAVKMSQSQFARAAGVSQQFVSEVRRGLKKPSVEMLAGLVGLGISGAWLLRGEGAMVAAQPQMSHGETFAPSPSIEPALAGALARLQRHPPPRDVQLMLAGRIEQVCDDAGAQVELGRAAS